MKNAKKKTTLTPMTVKGFTFRVCNADRPLNERHYEATNGQVVLTSKSLNYLIKKIKKIY